MTADNSKTVSGVLPVFQTPFHEDESLDRETLAAGGRHVSEESLVVSGVERFFISERIPLTDYKGEVVGICCVSQDLTRRRQLQQELQALIREVREDGRYVLEIRERRDGAGEPEPVQAEVLVVAGSRGAPDAR